MCDHHSVWSPACQDHVAGGHAGVGVVSPGGALLFLPSFVSPQFPEFFRLGRVLRTTLPIGKGGVVHLFVVYDYQVINFLLISFFNLFLMKLRWFVLVNLC